MNAWKFLLVASLILLALASCRAQGSAPQKKVYLAGERSLSGQVTWLKREKDKLALEVRFRNEGSEPVHFPKASISSDCKGTVLTARAAVTKESDVELQPGAEQIVKLYFDTGAAGLGAPEAGPYVIKVADIQKADDSAVGSDLWIPAVAR